MKKKRIIIIGVIVGLIILIGGGLFCYFKVGKKRIESKEYYGPVSNVSINYQVKSVSDEYILIKKGNLYGVIDSKGNVIIEPTIKDVNYINVVGTKTKYIVLSIINDDESVADKVYNIKGEKVLEKGYFGFFKEDPITGNEYYEASGYIYDKDLNEVFKQEDDIYIFNIIGDKVYYSTGYNSESKVYVYDLKSKSKLDMVYTEIINLKDAGTGNYFFALGDKSIVINMTTKEINDYGKGYVDPDNNKIVLGNGERAINYDYAGNKYKDSEITITRYSNGLYSDRKVCEYGSKLYDKNGKVISDKCNYRCFTGG